MQAAFVTVSPAFENLCELALPQDCDMQVFTHAQAYENILICACLHKNPHTQHMHELTYMHACILKFIYTACVFCLVCL